MAASDPAAIAVVVLLMAAVALKQYSTRWKKSLDGQLAADRLQNHLWGWDAMPAQLQNARQHILWSSYTQLALAAAATCAGSFAVIRGSGLSSGAAVLVPVLSLSGAVIWRSVRDSGDGGLAMFAWPWRAKWWRCSTAASALPTVILTGFLGAGKTTLLNWVLAEGGKRGLRFAVIENEVGAVGIDGELVSEAMSANERQQVVPHFIELSDGCICCTVRGDLQQALHQLRPKLSLEHIDMLVLETTGLAEPGPVVQTFLADAKLRDAYRLDSVVAVVDAKHVLQHLEDSEAAEDQRIRVHANNDTPLQEQWQPPQQQTTATELSEDVRELAKQIRVLGEQQEQARTTSRQASAAAAAAATMISGGDDGGGCAGQEHPVVVKAAEVARDAEAILFKLDTAAKAVQTRFEECRAMLRMPTMEGRKSETAKQLAFADKIVINKVDLVSAQDLEVRERFMCLGDPSARTHIITLARTCNRYRSWKRPSKPSIHRQCAGRRRMQPSTSSGC